jgi:F5/8 type C domain
MEQMRNLLIFLFGIISVLHSALANANYGFESGLGAEWQIGGTTGTQSATAWNQNGVGVSVVTGVTNYSPGGGKTWNITPYGTKMASIQGGGLAFDQITSGLGLSGVENTAIKNMLTYQSQNGGGGNPTPTTGSYMKREVTLQAGQTYTMAWQYLSTDYTPFNDGSIMTLIHKTDSNITPTLNNKQQRYSLLGFTNPGTGNYATGSYGATGWQVATFTVPVAGTYVLGFTSFNLGDTALSPILLVDEVQGSTTLNGQTFTPVNPNPGSDAPPPPPPPTPSVPTAVYNSGISQNVWITNHYPTSNNSPAGEGAANAFDNDPDTKYLNFDKKNAGVTVKLNVGKVITGFTLTTANDFPGRDPTSYKLYASNDGVTWTLISEGSLSLTDSRKTTSSMISVTNTNPYVYYYIFFPTTKAGEGCGLNCDSMQIAEITFYYESGNTATSTATGSGSVSNPSDLCCGGVSTPFNANSGFTTRAGVFSAAGDSRVIIEQIGNYNTANITQSGSKNYLEANFTGNNNSLTANQTTANSSTNYAELNVTGNSNTLNITQNNTGGSKGIMATVDNSSNSVTVNQSGTGNHYSEINLAGGNKTVNLTQSGSAAHMAKIELSGGATAITTTQTGATQQHYSITHNCAQASCSAITVTQGQ